MIDGTPDTAPSADALTPAEVAYFDSRGESALSEAEPAAEPAKTEAEPTVPAAEPAKQEPDKDPEVQKLVPHGAFEEERQRRKQAQQEAQQAREQAAKLQGMLEALQRGEKPADAAKTPGLEEIDIEKEPLKAIQALKQEIAERKQTEAAQQQIQGIIATGQQYCQKFAETEPQFFGKAGQEGAYQFLRRASAERLAEQGVPAHEIEQQVNLMEIRLINEAVALHQDPARAMWHWAQVAGFKPQTAAPAADPAPQQNRAPNGQFQAKEPTEAEKVAKAAEAQKASKSLGSVPAGSGEGVLTLEALANMDEADFAKATSGENWAKLHRNGVV